MVISDNLGFGLQHLSFVLGRQIDQALFEQLGIGLAQYKILMEIRGDSAVKQRAIAKSFGQTEAGISRQIKLLIAEHLITSRVNPANRRAHSMELTAKGEHVAEAANQIFTKHHDKIFASLNAHQQQSLADCLQMLHQSTCLPTKTAACNRLQSA